MKQYESVIKVMEENKGYSTLNYLYEKVPNKPEFICKAKDPFANIRRIVQDKRFFFKIKPGLWALKSYQKKLPDEINLLIEEDKDIKNEGKFTHSYFQGMIIEIGIMKGYKTYIPPQDQNKKCLNKTLKEIVDLKTIYKFTYDKLIQKVKSIDVFWFNDRKFPVDVFEIEHTSDCRIALIKFLELQDFNLKMHIVSSSARKSGILNKIDFTAFRPIKHKVEFMDYDYIEKLHSKVSKLHFIEKKKRGVAL